MRSELCSRLACDTITPLGTPVEPEVYCRNARVSSSEPDGRQSVCSAVGTASTATHRSGGMSSISSVSARNLTSSAVTVNTTTACESCTIARTRGKLRALRGGYAGTAVMPA